MEGGAWYMLAERFHGVTLIFLTQPDRRDPLAGIFINVDFFVFVYFVPRCNRLRAEGCSSRRRHKCHFFLFFYTFCSGVTGFELRGPPCSDLRIRLQTQIWHMHMWDSVPRHAWNSTSSLEPSHSDLLGLLGAPCNSEIGTSDKTGWDRDPPAHGGPAPPLQCTRRSKKTVVGSGALWPMEIGTPMHHETMKI